MAQSPLNYTGGKFKLLPQILPLFPPEIDTFIDLFCGGGDVGTSVQCNRVLFNDINSNIIGIFESFKQLPKEDIFKAIKDIIAKYNLSDVSEKGYAYYNCDSGKGLGNFNREPFNQLKAYFNNLEQKDNHYYLILYVLIVYSFNNQIRFNKQGKFNLPIGKRDFNAKMQTKLSAFVERLHDIDCVFSNKDFREVKIKDGRSFVYADPPYLITCASYNEQGGWSEVLERELHRYLDKLNTRNIRFALSNVLTSKGKTNCILKEWLERNPQYVCHHLNYNYSNSNYHTAGRETVSDEVLITNY